MDYAKALIRAPMDSRVLAVFGRVGQQVGSEGFGLIGDTSQMLIRAEVYETDIARLHVGQRAEVTSSAITDVLTGAVSRIGVRIEGQTILSTDPAAIVDARVVEIWVTLDAESSVKVAEMSGLQVVTRFLTGEGDDALG